MPVISPDGFLSRSGVRVTRRQFTAYTAALLGTAWWVPKAYGIVRRQLDLGANPFTLGVASGDPSADGFVLWTRLAPQPTEGGGMPAENIEVRWTVATDDSLQKPVAQGTVIATPELGHSVHVEVAGLEPHRPYWYRFDAAGASSPIGLTRTMPTRESSPEKLRFAFASCQHYEAGLYTAYEHLAQEELDLVFHLGDYIYEYRAGAGGKVRTHVGPEITTLEHYRNRHAQYKTDPHLQAAHACVPWVVTWDDHEVDNNYADSISEEAGVTAEQLLIRRAQAYKAYYEHMPLRASSIPVGPDMQLYRRLHFGQLADFSVLDTRQYRSDQPCGDGNKPPCEASLDPATTLLGAEQERWLMEGLSSSTSVWNVLAQQVMMGRVDFKAGDTVTHSMDQWPGYEANRQRLLQFWRDHQIANPVVLTGDIHSNWVNNLQVDSSRPEDAVVGTEFVATSISSGGNGSQAIPIMEAFQKENPFVQFFNAERGYVSCEVSPTEWTSHFRVVEDVEQPGAPLITRASFTVAAGQPGAVRG